MTRHHIADPHPHNPMGLKFETPSCQDMSISRGSTVHLCGPGDDHEYPANVPSIQLVRLIDAKNKYRKPKIPVMASPYDEGELAYLKGQPITDNPYSDKNRWSEWNDGYRAEF
jgi:hypothetical protein